MFGFLFQLLLGEIQGREVRREDLSTLGDFMVNYCNSLFCSIAPRCAIVRHWEKANGANAAPLLFPLGRTRSMAHVLCAIVRH
jgi:hypothetical protein